MRFFFLLILLLVEISITYKIFPIFVAFNHSNLGSWFKKSLDQAVSGLHSVIGSTLVGIGALAIKSSFFFLPFLCFQVWILIGSTLVGIGALAIKSIFFFFYLSFISSCNSSCVFFVDSSSYYLSNLHQNITPRTFKSWSILLPKKNKKKIELKKKMTRKFKKIKKKVPKRLFQFQKTLFWNYFAIIFQEMPPLLILFDTYIALRIDFCEKA